MNIGTKTIVNKMSVYYNPERYFAKNKKSEIALQGISIPSKHNVLHIDKLKSSSKDLVFINTKAIQVLKKNPKFLLEFSNSNVSTKSNSEQISALDMDSIQSSSAMASLSNSESDVTISQNPVASHRNSGSIATRNLALKDKERNNQVQLHGKSNELNPKNKQKVLANLLSKYVFNKFFICCKESRIESPSSFYGCFLIGPFDESLSQTLAHNIRRTLLSQLSGLAITAVEIDGVLHKFSNLPGLKESILDVICNLQNIVFKKNIKNVSGNSHSQNFLSGLTNNPTFEKIELIAYLRVRGPGIVSASDIILPSGIQCVNSDQYIATLAEDGFLNMKIYIQEGQNYIKQKQKNFDLAELKQQFLVEKNTSLVNNKGATFFEQPITSVTFSSQEEDGGIPTSSSQSESQSQMDKLDSSILITTPNKIYFDSVFMPVTKVNTIVQVNPKSTDDLLENNLQFRLLNSTELMNKKVGTKRKAFAGYGESAGLSTLRPVLNHSDRSNALADTNAVAKKKQVRLVTLRNYRLDVTQSNATVGATPHNGGIKTSTFFEQSSQTNNFDHTQTGLFSQFKNKKHKTFTNTVSTSLFSLKSQEKASTLDTVQSCSASLINTFFTTNINLEKKLLDQVLVLTAKPGRFNGALSTNKNTESNNELLKPNNASAVASAHRGGVVTSSISLGEQNSMTSSDNTTYLASLPRKKIVSKQSHIIVEIWTNGSIHPREALKNCIHFLTHTFISLDNVKMIGSMFKSDLTYTKVLKKTLTT